MPFISYKEKRFSTRTLTLIETANAIIDEYSADGLTLTLRQLYYQFVARDLIENSQKSYKRLGSIINEARLCGMIDWNAIEDRTRALQANGHWETPASIIYSARMSYRIDMWSNQRWRPEVWIEKEALAGVLAGLCSDLDVGFFSCRGYTSQSEMWAAGERFLNYQAEDQKVVIVHLGDHDPSGIDMTRDIEDRLQMFTGMRFDGYLTIERIALNYDQIRRYNPPPNPAKVTDSRAGKYIKKYGRKSWELDALEPRVLQALVRNKVLSYRDDDLYQERLDKLAADRAVLDELEQHAAGL